MFYVWRGGSPGLRVSWLGWLATERLLDCLLCFVSPYFGLNVSFCGATLYIAFGKEAAVAIAGEIDVEGWIYLCRCFCCVTGRRYGDYCSDSVCAVAPVYVPFHLLRLACLFSRLML